MRKDISTGLPAMNQPFSWAVESKGIMFTAHGPVTREGQIAELDIEGQARLTFDNLRTAVEAGGRTLDDVAQVLIYMIAAGDMAVIDRVYREFFSEPWPNRSSVVVSGFVHPRMKMEIVAYVGTSVRA
jgi:2-iminobutanoate/2-iminopropanoate deaminase